MIDFVNGGVDIWLMSGRQTSPRRHVAHLAPPGYRSNGSEAESGHGVCADGGQLAEIDALVDEGAIHPVAIASSASPGAALAHVDSGRTADKAVIALN